MRYETAVAVRQIAGGLFRLQRPVVGLVARLFVVAFFASAGSPFRAGRPSIMGRISAIASPGSPSSAVAQVQIGHPDQSMACQTGLHLGSMQVLAVALFLDRGPEHTEHPARLGPGP